MKVLVTGGSGFLGSSVVRGLAAAGHDVVSTDLRAPAVVMDVTSASNVSAVIGEARPEVVVHLASIVTPGPDSTRELEYAVDVTGTRHVLDACVEHGVRRVVISSSGAAYGYHADNGESNGGWITEDQPVRGNEEFAYSHHKRLVEEMLPSYSSLEQVVLRIGTILGRSVDNQITALFERKRLLRIRGSESPFVFVWDEDVVAIIQQAVIGPVTGVFNVAGDGALTISDIAELLGKPLLTIPEPVLRGALAVGSRLGLTPYGPEQTMFLQYRPVLSNERLKTVFGYTPTRTSRQAFDEWRGYRQSY